MAETEKTEKTSYVDTLQEVLLARKEWMDVSELGKLKENLRSFHTSFASLYNIYLKKKLIDEDPYKHEAKISELEVPDAEPFQEAKRIEQLSIRLSNYDNQLDFLVNFYQLGIDYLNIDRIKRIVGLIRYIDWVNLSPDSQSIMTKAVAELSNQSKAGVDTLTLGIIGESLSRLSKTTSACMGTLKDLNTYYRELYKLSVRQKVTQSMAANEATPDNIKKKIASAMPGTPFYKELIEELIKEDYTPSGPDLREALLNTLRIKIEKPKNAKPAVNFKNILLEGIQIIGSANISLTEIGAKLDENQMVMESHKKGFMFMIKELIRQLTHAEPEEVIYNVEYLDATKGVNVREKISFHQFRDDINKRARILSSLARGPAYNKLAAMTEDQIITYLERHIKDVQNMHRSLNALDDYFKAHVEAHDRDKIKGIKPELSALKNTLVKANQRRYEYSAQKEEEDQLKRLGFNPETAAATASTAAGAPVAAPTSSS